MNMLDYYREFQRTLTKLRAEEESLLRQKTTILININKIKEHWYQNGIEPPKD